MDFRQVLSLDPDVVPTLPDLSVVDRRLIGPIADLLTFYADLWLAIVKGVLSRPGDRFYEEAGTASSWADGAITIHGESSIDFDVMLEEIDRSAGRATLFVRHVPPREPQISLPATWMAHPAADTRNNWVQVRRSGDAYLASVGKETFDVRIEVDLRDGKILSASMGNVVQAIERHCRDSDLSDCDEDRPRKIQRRVEITLTNR